MKRRIIVLFAGQILLWAMVAQVNHALTPLRLYVFAGALFVVYGALLQSWRAGMTSTLLAGLMCDASAPVDFGTHMLLFAAAHVAVYHLRDRLPREDTIGQIVVVLLVNLGLFLVFSGTQIHRSPAPMAIWPRLIADLLCSQVFLLLITPWFFALQTRALVLVRLERENFA